jgi:hypothetical protein
MTGWQYHTINPSVWGDFEEMVAHRLNRLGDNGWRVKEVTENRRVIMEKSSDTIVLRWQYVLVKKDEWDGRKKNPLATEDCQKLNELGEQGWQVIKMFASDKKLYSKEGDVLMEREISTSTE